MSTFIPTFTIYTLRDEAGAVRYVGCTSQPPEWRLQQHRQAKTTVGDWVRSEIKQGRRVEIVIEEQHSEKGFTFDAATQIENQYISGYRRLLGDFLLNRCGPRIKRTVLSAEALAMLRERSHMTPLEKRRALINLA